MSDKLAVLTEIRTYYEERNKTSEALPGDVTYDDVKEYNHIGHSAAQRLMKRLVDEGKFEKLEIKVDGRRRVVFRKLPPG